MPPLRVALGEYDTGWESPDASLHRAGALVARAAAAGARLVVLPEMCTTGFTMDAARWAEPIDGPAVARLGTMAREARVWLLAGVAVAEPREAGLARAAHNAALLLDPTGKLVSVYRKQRLFAHGGEDRSYVPGSRPVTVAVEGVRVSPFVCYDLRFPELFRAVAHGTDAIVILANWPVARRAHWDVLLRARAIENLCHVVAVNRIGEGGGSRYDGGSVAYDPWGEPLAGPTAPGDDLALVDIDPERVRAVRAAYPFLDGLGVVAPGGRHYP